MSLDFDKDNHNIVTIKFTNLQSDSQVQIEAIDNATFKSKLYSIVYFLQK